jgi:dTMP kinase
MNMTTKTARFIVLEGLDGTGKSTQVKLLREYFGSRSLATHFIHFPRTDEESSVFGPMVARFLRGDYGPIENVHPELVALIYAGDRYNAADELKNHLKSGTHIIADRYVFSNIGFQCAKLSNNMEREELIRRIFSMEYEYFKIPEPDISVFLHVPIDFVEQQLRSERSGEGRNYLQGRSDIHEQSMDFQRAVEQVYLDACRLFPDQLIYHSCINAQGNMMTPQEIHQQLVQLLTDRGLL